MKNILCVVGTRPEAIKMAPVILALKKQSWAQTKVLATAQHREMMDQALSLFAIKPDFDLDIMKNNQNLTELTANLLVRAGKVLDFQMPDLVLVQGDTASVMSLALAAFYRGIPIGHIEAGLRSGNNLNPFPEEANRVITSHLARWHFAPTEKAKCNLLREGLSANNIFVTGNTVIDALLYVAARQAHCENVLPNNMKSILITVHRRENFGEPLINICLAIRELANKYHDCFFIFPVHPNPNVQKIVYRYLNNIDNLKLCQPFDYSSFVDVMKNCTLIISDSGGVQEEATAFGKPVMILRENTERLEAIEAGMSRLIGTDRSKIVSLVSEVLDDKGIYAAMVQNRSPFGDGQAGKRIVDILSKSV